MSKLTPTATVTATVAVTLDVRVQQMLKARIEEHARLATRRKEDEARQKRIEAEVDELLDKAGQSAALEDGMVVDGFRLKRVGGTTKTLDKAALMRAVGIDAVELDAFYDEKPKRSYLKITAPGQRNEDYE